MPFILELLREFYGKAGGIYNIPFDDGSTARTISTVILHGVCLVGPTSCAGAVIAGFDFNERVKVASVSFWCFRAAREMMILDALIAACKEAGADKVAVASQFPANTISKHYERLGFTFVEQKALLRI